MKKEDKEGLKKACDEIKRIKKKFLISNNCTDFVAFKGVIKHVDKRIYHKNKKDKFGHWNKPVERTFFDLLMNKSYYHGRLSVQRELKDIQKNAL